MKSASITVDGNSLIVDSPFNRDFVDALKNAIPHTERKWDGGKKVWSVAVRHADTVAALCKEHFGSVIDNRAGDVDVEEAKLEAEIAQIGNNRQVILSRTAEIETIISELSAIISRYSYSSASRVKEAYAKDRALLQHSLDNAKLTVEQMTELQVRGLAAAVKYLERNNYTMERY